MKISLQAYKLIILSRRFQVQMFKKIILKGKNLLKISRRVLTDTLQLKEVKNITFIRDIVHNQLTN